MSIGALSMLGKFVGRLTVLAVAALLIASPQIESASAKSPLGQAWKRYKNSCDVYLGHKKVWDELQAEIVDAHAKLNQKDCILADAGNQFCEKQAALILRNQVNLEAFRPWLLWTKETCDTNRQSYADALTELVLEAMLTGPEPDPYATTKRRPPAKAQRKRQTRKRKPPVKKRHTRRRREPYRTPAEADREALEAIGGIIIQGISRGSKKRTRRRRRHHPPPRRGNVIP